MKIEWKIFRLETRKSNQIIGRKAMRQTLRFRENNQWQTYMNLKGCLSVCLSVAERWKVSTENEGYVIRRNKRKGVQEIKWNSIIRSFARSNGTLLFVAFFLRENCEKYLCDILFLERKKIYMTVVKKKKNARSIIIKIRL